MILARRLKRCWANESVAQKMHNTIVEQKFKRVHMPPFQLFNLANDPTEKNDVIDQHPDVASRLKERLDQIIASGRTRRIADPVPAD